MTTTSPGMTPAAIAIKADKPAQSGSCRTRPMGLVDVVSAIASDCSNLLFMSIKMKKFVLALAGVILVSGQAAADSHWKYVVIHPDGKQVATSTHRMDISYPPDETSHQGGVPAPRNQRIHLIIVAPDASPPEPMFLSNKAAKTTVEAPPKNLPPQEVQTVTTVEPQAIRRAPALPPTRNFLNSGSNVRH